MLGFPKVTELNKQLPKKAIYAKFQMSTAAKEKIDEDISRISIVNEITAQKINVAEGETVKSFYVLLVVLKKKDFDEKNIITISKIIPQNMIMVLECEDKARIAVYHSKLMMTQWLKTDDSNLELKGLNLDKIWENLVIQIGEITIEKGKSLEEQISIDDEREKIKKEIEKLEKAARNEKQPRKKFELVQRLNAYKERLEGCQ